MKLLSLVFAVIVASACGLSAADTMRDETLLLISQTPKSSPSANPPLKKAPSEADIPSIFVHEPKGSEPSAIPTKRDVPSTEPEPHEATVILPKVEVKAAPIRDLQRDLRNHDNATAVESTYAIPSEFDSIANNKKISLPAWFFGGQDAEVRAGKAQRRLELMALERKVIIAMDTAKTADEKRSLRILLGDIQEMVRDISL